MLGERLSCCDNCTRELHWHCEHREKGGSPARGASTSPSTSRRDVRCPVRAHLDSKVDPSLSPAAPSESDGTDTPLATEANNTFASSGSIAAYRSSRRPAGRDWKSRGSTRLDVSRIRDLPHPPSRSTHFVTVGAFPALVAASSHESSSNITSPPKFFISSFLPFSTSTGSSCASSSAWWSNSSISTSCSLTSTSTISDAVVCFSSR